MYLSTKTLPRPRAFLKEFMEPNAGREGPGPGCAGETAPSGAGESNVCSPGPTARSYIVFWEKKEEM